MSGRSDELRRERDLLRAQLARLDAEIEKAEAAQPVIPQFRAPAQGAADPDLIIEEFTKPQASVTRRAKLGCILYFAAALALLALFVAAVHFYAKATRGH